MTLEQIKTALSEGKKVYYCNPAYTVIKDRLNQYLIEYRLNGDVIGLTWRDGVTLNGKEESFYIGE
jgi:hypothetical protein